MRYIVMQGEYEDFRVVGELSTLKNAIHVAKRFVNETDEDAFIFKEIGTISPKEKKYGKYKYFRR